MPQRSRKWPATVTAGEMAELLGLSSRKLQHLAQAGAIKRAPERGRVFLRESVAGYVRHVRNIDRETALQVEA